MITLETENKFQLHHQVSSYGNPSTTNNGGNSNSNSNTPSRSTSTNSAITTLATPPSTLSSYGSTVLSNSLSPSNQTHLSGTTYNPSYINTTSPENVQSNLNSNASIQAISTIVRIIVS